MAIASPPPKTRCLTFEEYLNEGEIMARYDIIEGERIYMPAPKVKHQCIQINLSTLLRTYAKQSGNGYAVGAPCDVVIRRAPRLQTRQPDVLYISHQRVAQEGIPLEDLPFFSVAPELMVEIISDSDRQDILAGKLADYLSIGVLEVWLVWPDTHKVEVMELTSEGAVVVVSYGETQTLQSLTFPDLQIPVADIFAL